MSFSLFYDIKTLDNGNKIANVSKPASIECLPSCEVQNNDDKMSFALYPHRSNFFHQKTFCFTASHIWQVTCQDVNRKYFLGIKQPDLCQTLNYFNEYFGNTSSCDKWPKNFLEDLGTPNDTLVKEMFRYGRKNIALVRVMIQSPYVTKIKRDVAMTFTSYVANSGGLLGLCLGFSFISGIELIFWLCCCFQEFIKLSYCRHEVISKRKK